MRNAVAVVALALMSLAHPAEALAQDGSRAFAAGTEAFGDDDYLRALAHFEDAKKAGLAGPAIDYNIAVCHYRLGNYAQAEAAFRSVGNSYPKMRALTEYNLGLVSLRQHRVSEARALFEQARQRSSDDKLTALAAAMLRRLDASSEPAAREARWHSLVDLNVGHDDNVALLEDSSVPAGQSVDSAYTEALAVVMSPLATGTGFRFNGSAYTVRYDDASQFDQTAVSLGGSYRRTTRDWRMEAESHFNHSTLDGDGFEQKLGVGVHFRRYLSASTVFGIHAIHDEVAGVEAQFAYLDGSREQLGVSWERYGAAGRFTLGYYVESNDRAGASVSPSRNRVSLRYLFTMSPSWNADFGLSFRSSSYDDLAIPVDEDLTELSLGLLRYFGRGLRLGGIYRWSDNSSDVDGFSYTRSRVSLGLSKSF